MNPLMMVLVGFVGGLGFGLMVAWGMIGLLGAGIGVAVLLVGSIFPSFLRGVFGFAIMGFMVAFIAAGGLSLI